MNSKLIKLLSLTFGVLALTAAIVSAEEKKDDGKKCPNCPNCPDCPKEQPKAIVSGDTEKKDDGKKCPNCPDCPKEQPKA